ncbi:hypothetical protein HK102_010442, partial [Quaeritorhiza haematococci]
AAVRTAAENGWEVYPKCNFSVIGRIKAGRGRGRRTRGGISRSQIGESEGNLFDLGDRALRCDKKRGITLVYVKNYDDLDALCAHLIQFGSLSEHNDPLPPASLQMHGTDTRSALAIAATGINLHYSNAVSEFSTEPAFYTSSSSKAAAGRAVERGHRDDRAIAFFSLPSNSSCPHDSDGPLWYTFGETLEERTAWRRLIWNNFHNESELIPLCDEDGNGGDAEERATQVMQADIVEGRISFRPRAKHINLIQALFATQVGFLTPDAVEFLNKGRIPVVAVLEGGVWDDGGCELLVDDLY